MKVFVVIVALAAAAASGPALAQTTTPNVVNPTPGLQTPLTFTTTNCLMSCNSQAANCRTACVLPVVPTAPPSPSSNPAANLNSAAGTTCLLACGSTQNACQSNCALNSPSR